MTYSKEHNKTDVLKGRAVKKNLPALLAAFLLLCFAETGFANLPINSMGSMPRGQGASRMKSS